jgi:uncharacterized membrane protein YfcA
MLAESFRAFWSARRGRVKPARRGGEHAAYLGWPLRMRFPRSKLYASAIPIMAVALFVGFVGSLLGIGGGFIIVPALLYLFRVPTAVVIGTSQFQILWTAIAALILHAVVFRLLLALLVLGVGLRFAIELVLEPAEPFSIAVAEPPA